MNYYIDLKLNTFIDSRIIEMYDDDIRANRKGIFIPFDINGIRLSKRGNVYCMLQARECLYPSIKGTHVLYRLVNRNVAKEIQKRFGCEKHMFGKMRPSKYF